MLNCNKELIRKTFSQSFALCWEAGPRESNKNLRHPVPVRPIKSLPWRGRGQPGTAVMMEALYKFLTPGIITVFPRLKDAAVMHSRATWSRGCPAPHRGHVLVLVCEQYVMHGAVCYMCACTLASGGRTWGRESTGLRVTELGDVPCAEPCRRPGHLGCFTAPLIGSELREIWVWDRHWQGTCQKLRLRLLPSNVNRGQRHRELSAIKNTRAWNRNTHKAYGINTTKEDLRTFSVPSL